MKKIKLSFPNNISHAEKQTSGFSSCWGDCQFFINQDIDECDAWVVCENIPLPQEATNCPPSNIILITGEPRPIWHYEKKFVKQFSRIITSQREIKGPGVVYSIQGHGWYVGLDYKNPNDLGWAKGYDELVGMDEVPKTKLLSVITSDKQYTVGHIQRYKFALKLKEVFGDQVDLFGRGINDFNDKWDVLAPYKYSIAIENCATNDYVSEKLTDCFLSHTFPFYYGAPNVDHYYPKESYDVIDIKNFSKSVDRIKEVLSNPTHYQDHLSAIKDAKKKYLDNYHVFPLIASFMKDWSNERVEPKEKIILKQASSKLSLDNRFRIASDRIKVACSKIIQK